MKKLRRRVEKVKGLCVGLDLHKRFIQVSVLNEQGDEVMSDRIASQAQLLAELIDQLATHGQPMSVAIEASGCFVWVYDQLVKRLGRSSVHVAAPSKVKAIAESGEKTDAGDAWWLAYLMQEGRLPEAFVAEGDLRELRIATRELRSVIDERSDLMRRMRSHLAQLGWTFGKSDWASEVGRQRIASLVAAAQAQHGMRGEAISRLWSRIQTCSQEVSYWEDRATELSSSFKQIKLIDELPGLGPTLAAIVWSELGDPQRYKNAKAYAKATGLTPGYSESGGRRKKQTITREGSAHVRWALTRAVLACQRCTNNPAGLRVKQWVMKMARRKPRKAAMVAAARKLAEGVWRLFALGEALDLRRMFPGGPPSADRPRDSTPHRPFPLPPKGKGNPRKRGKVHGAQTGLVPA